MPDLSPGLIDALAQRVATLEAERAVRATITRYMALCDVPEDAGDGPGLAGLFTADAVWEGIGPQYAHKFGRLEGTAAIVAMLHRYLPPDPHFSANLHFLTSESIDVDDDRTRARGRWIMLQASRYADGTAELIAARLTVDFAPAADRPAWLIRHFRTERVLDGPWPLAAAPRA
ncbi:polyketide cyclase [Burkholderia stabilis]|uniref:nuclear transport factor 2 family protein n=1 Tax=Burkholderia stabilis TaxID=95485 RepID=UPI0008518D49|nr:nuclear transport factor 2 family protein [Burkholderia stabilis]AOR71831.1 polyketide cyclase [Burkholderia stabilis]HDR9492730.1 nuclear transport factor 2 family protein [Burkholderia stabilis]HDR9525866.1 nuclear transport factor 2 family protein [Burkholderia stabilis]HDR9532190.1 nuclear transport factor 2 family protein [Burkholderia stabilis]HDR9540041.1 nuclear transport factor 2 family protein [Burkholderia stabilis]